jgi:cytochrome c556
MQVAHAATSELEGAVSSKDGAKADAAYAKLKTACDACHAEYRNNL